MTLEETLIKMREKNDDDKFYPLVESMKRRAEKGLLEGVKPGDIEACIKKIEMDKIRQEQVEINLKQEMFEINEAVEKFGYLDEESKPEVLDEAVTFIDNAGSLKTMSTEDYVKDMHEYHTETQIEDYKKRKKKRDYKLISEEIDIDSLKKLSEMSFEEILSEEFLEGDESSILLEIRSDVKRLKKEIDKEKPTPEWEREFVKEHPHPAKQDLSRKLSSEAFRKANPELQARYMAHMQGKTIVPTHIKQVENAEFNARCDTEGWDEEERDEYIRDRENDAKEDLNNAIERGRQYKRDAKSISKKT